jgi:hypothetical protein
MGRCKSNERVVAYHLDGRLFRIYESARKAALNRHAHPRTIDKCIRGDSLTAFGYMWRRYPVDSIPEQIEPFQKPTSTFAPVPIAEIDENGNVIHYFESIKNAGKTLGIDPHSIRDNLRGKGKQTCYFPKLKQQIIIKPHMNTKQREMLLLISHVTLKPYERGW